MTADRPRRDRTVELWHRVSGDATRLAYLLDADAGAAAATAHRVFGRCLARLQDRRSTYLIDVGVRSDVVRLVIRRRRRRALRAWFARKPVPLEDAGVQLGHRRARLWRAFVHLRLKQRAAIALESYEGLPRGEAADVLGCSYGGVTALVDRGWEALAASLGGAPDAEELDSLLRDVAEEVEAPTLEPHAIRTRARRARAATLITVLCLVGVLAAITGAIAATVNEGDEVPRLPEERGGDRVRIETDVGVWLEGTPGWCPDPRGTLPLGQASQSASELVVRRVAMALVNKYADRLGHLIEVPDTAPSIKRWTTTGGPAGLRVVGSGPGTANVSLVEMCGRGVADRTWIIVLEDPLAPHGDEVAFYVLRRADGLKVWGTFGGTDQTR